MSETPESISYIRIGENEHPIDAATLNGKEASEFQEGGEIVRSIDQNSTDEQIPSARCIYGIIYGLPPLPANNINVRKTESDTITATATYPVDSDVVISLSGDITGTITIPSGETTGTLTITPSSSDLTCNLSITSGPDYVYDYELDSSTINVDASNEYKYLTIVNHSFKRK